MWNESNRLKKNISLVTPGSEGLQQCLIPWDTVHKSSQRTHRTRGPQATSLTDWARGAWGGRKSPWAPGPGAPETHQSMLLICCPCSWSLSTKVFWVDIFNQPAAWVRITCNKLSMILFLYELIYAGQDERNERWTKIFAEVSANILRSTTRPLVHI